MNPIGYNEFKYVTKSDEELIELSEIFTKIIALPEFIIEKEEPTLIGNKSP